MLREQSVGLERWHPDEKGETVPDSKIQDPKRRSVLPVAAAGAVAVIIGVAGFAACARGGEDTTTEHVPATDTGAATTFAEPALDRSTPEATATAYAQFAAVADPTVCELADRAWKSRLMQSNSCVGNFDRATSVATVVGVDRRSNNEATVHLVADPVSWLTAPGCFAIELTTSDGEWSVISATAPTPVTERATCT